MHEGNVTVFVKFKAKAGSQTELKSLLLDMAGQSSQDPGCIKYDVFQNKNDETEFMLSELWETQSDADNHAQMDYLPAYRERRAPMLDGNPEVSTWISHF